MSTTRRTTGLRELVNAVRAQTQPLIESIARDRPDPIKRPEKATPTKARPITMAAVVSRYECGPRTVRRYVKAGTLTDLRPVGHAKNVPLVLDENEVAQHFATQ